HRMAPGKHLHLPDPEARTLGDDVRCSHPIAVIAERDAHVIWIGDEHVGVADVPQGTRLLAVLALQLALPRADVRIPLATADFLTHFPAAHHHLLAVLPA